MYIHIYTFSVFFFSLEACNYTSVHHPFGAEAGAQDTYTHTDFQDTGLTYDNESQPLKESNLH